MNDVRTNLKTGRYGDWWIEVSANGTLLKGVNLREVREFIGTTRHDEPKEHLHVIVDCGCQRDEGTDPTTFEFESDDQLATFLDALTNVRNLHPTQHVVPETPVSELDFGHNRTRILNLLEDTFDCHGRKIKTLRVLYETPYSDLLATRGLSYTGLVCIAEAMIKAGVEPKGWPKKIVDHARRVIAMQRPTQSP